MYSCIFVVTLLIGFIYGFKQTNISVQAGKTVNITCLLPDKTNGASVTWYGPPNRTPYYANHKMNYLKKGNKVSIFHESEKRFVTLEIKEFSKSDVGMYWCFMISDSTLVQNRFWLFIEVIDKIQLKLWCLINESLDSITIEIAKNLHIGNVTIKIEDGIESNLQCSYNCSTCSQWELETVSTSILLMIMNLKLKTVVCYQQNFTLSDARNVTTIIKEMKSYRVSHIDTVNFPSDRKGSCSFAMRRFGKEQESYNSTFKGMIFLPSNQNVYFKVQWYETNTAFFHFTEPVPKENETLGLPNANRLFLVAFSMETKNQLDNNNENNKTDNLLTLIIVGIVTAVVVLICSISLVFIVYRKAKKMSGNENVNENSEPVGTDQGTDTEQQKGVSMDEKRRNADDKYHFKQN